MLISLERDKSGMAMDILFKPCVEATEQMTQNRAFRNPKINERAKSRLWHVCGSSFLFPL